MAAGNSVAGMKKYFRRLKDPRVVGRSRHLPIDIVVLAICGMIANCDNWPDIELFASPGPASCLRPGGAIIAASGVGRPARFLQEGLPALSEKRLAHELLAQAPMPSTS